MRSSTVTSSARSSLLAGLQGFPRKRFLFRNLTLLPAVASDAPHLINERGGRESARVILTLAADTMFAGR